MATDTVSDILRIDGRFYDTNKLAAIHPGGETFITTNNMKDGTALFNMSHRRSFPHDKYQQYVVKNPDPVIVKEYFAVEYSQDFSLYFQLCKDIAPVLRNNGFAPWHYYLKVAFLVLGIVFIDFYVMFVERTLLMSFLGGLLGAGIALNIQHDANHGACSRNPAVNRWLGYTQDLIGGCGLKWMLKHTIHHVSCNDPTKDVDMELPMLRMDQSTPWWPFHSVQHIYFTLLEAGFGPFALLTHWLFVIAGPQAREHQILKPQWNTHRLFLVYGIGRVALALYLQPTLWTAVNLAIFFCCGGLYLAFFIMQSHNFEGVAKGAGIGERGCFVKHQTETSSNMGGWLLAQFNGGLNFQIEHHLFPRIHHSFYPYLAPIVRKRCEEKGIKYTHFPTITENMMSTFRHLRTLGQRPKAKSL